MGDMVVDFLLQILHLDGSQFRSAGAAKRYRQRDDRDGDLVTRWPAHRRFRFVQMKTSARTPSQP